MKKWLICVGIIVSAMTSKVHAGETPTESTGYTQTKYPIVLVHSAFGFSQMFLFDYFHAIPEALTRDGADVHIAKLSPIHNMEVRGEQLLAQVEDIIAATGKEKVHLFGHSYGSPTARYVASVRPELVASVTSIGGANINIPIADAFRAIAKQGGLIEGVSALTVNSLAPLVTLLNDGGFLPSDLVALVDGATKEGFADFNQRHPQGLPADCGSLPSSLAENGVHYFSWGGNKVFTNIFDPSDIALFGLSLLTSEENDGAIPRCSSHLGLVLRDDYKMNHIDMVNGILGLHAGGDNNPVTLYRQQANRLKNLAL